MYDHSGNLQKVDILNVVYVYLKAYNVVAGGS